MRINGKVTYYEPQYGTGIIHSNTDKEFYFFKDEQFLKKDFTVYDGMVLSFETEDVEHELVAKNIKPSVHILKGIVSLINLKRDLIYITTANGIVYWSKHSNCIVTQRGRAVQLYDQVQFNVWRGEHKVCRAINVLCDNRFALSRFCRYIYMKNICDDIVAIAQPENWNYTNLETDDSPLLVNYIIHTFENSIKQDLISYYINDSKTYACAYFNTGLVSKMNQDVIMVFSKKIKNAESWKTPENWKYSLCSDADANIIINSNNGLRAPVYKSQRGYNTFDTNIAVTINFESTIAHVFHLLPKEMIVKGKEYSIAAVNSAIANSLQLIRDGKITPEKKYYHNDIEFIAPLYYKQKQLPLAVLIKRLSANEYIANTLIPLDKAYKNARLLGAIKSEWLKPVCCFSNMPEQF